MSTEHGNAFPLRRWLGAAALAGLSLTAHAQTATAAASAFDRFMSTATGAGKTTVSVGSDGTPLAAPGVPTVQADGGAGVKTTHSGDWRNPSGNPVRVTATGRIPNAQIASRIAGATAKILPVAGTVAGVVELYDLFKELGLDTKDGQIVKPNPGACTVAPCYEYSTRTPQSTAIQEPYVSENEACVRAIAQVKAHHGSPEKWVVSTCAYQGGLYMYRSDMTWVNAAYPLARRERPVQSPTAPMTLQELENEIASKSGWPSNSKVAPALVKASELTGEKLKPEQLTVTGPASSPGPAPKVETKPNPDGSTQTKTTTTTHNHTYNTNVVTTVTNNVTNITNYGETGKTGQETSEEAPAPEPEPPEDPCKDNPDRAGCRDMGEPEDGEVPKVQKDVTFTAENLGFGSGSCPTGPSWTDRTGSRTMSLQPVCNMATGIVRPILLALAALGAVFIIMPRGD